MRAFDRMARKPLPQVTNYPRHVRLAIDYSLRVTVGDIESDAEADTFAHHCRTLGVLAQRDIELGDPPATGTAMKAAEAAGPNYVRAFSLLNSIRDES
jgi:hypothetical protein